MSTLRVAAVQMAMSERMEENYRKSLKFLREAAEGGAKLVCFPEGQLGRYLPQYPGLDAADFAIEADHPYLRGFQQACRELGVLAVVSVCLKEAEKVYAAAVLISEEGEILHVEKKKHIVRAPNFYERDYFTPGDGPIRPVETSVGRIGIIMCFDRHYPESFRSLALQGCDFAVVPVANDRTEPLELFEWELRIPAFQNGMYTLMVNRVGTEGRMDFAGRSVFSDPDGAVPARAGEEEGITWADLDFTRCAQQRARKQYLELRRPAVFTLK